MGRKCVLFLYCSVSIRDFTIPSSSKYYVKACPSRITIQVDLKRKITRTNYRNESALVQEVLYIYIYINIFNVCV
jgi:hypothetical protein